MWLKGIYCKYCLWFPLSTRTMKGGWASFIIRPFTKYKDCTIIKKTHVQSQGHQTTIESVRPFMEGIPVDIQFHQTSQKFIEKNITVLSSIVSCIIFSGTHDLPLRGKNLNEGVLIKLCNLHIKVSDFHLKDDFEHWLKNVSYLSPIIQNEIIELWGATIITRVKKSCAYSFLADETVDISDKEQMFIGLHFFNEI